MAGAGIDAETKKNGEVEPVAADSLAVNCRVVYYCRTFLAIVAGVAAGILGLTGLSGFLFYVVIMAFSSIGLLVKAGFDVNSYFDSWTRIVLDGLGQGLMVSATSLS
eukprot:jgi/Mesen1/9486/ME000063S08940